MITRAQLVDAARDLNTILTLKPEIPLTSPASQLRSSIVEASGLIQEGDALAEATRAVVEELTRAGAAAALEPDAPTPTDGTEAEIAETETEEAAETETEIVQSRATFQHEGSKAQRMDAALMKGGDLEELAVEAGVSKGMLRGHARSRAKKTAKWQLEEDGNNFKLTPVAAEPAPVVTVRPARTRGGDVGAGGFMVPSRRYNGSRSQRMDTALMKGGDLATLATEAGVKRAMLRAHAKSRSKNWRWQLVEDGENFKLIPRAEPASAA